MQQTHLARQSNVLAHRQTHGGDGAAEVDGGVGDLLHTMDVRREARRDDALALVLVEQVVEHLTHRRLRLRVPVLFGVRAVGEQQPDAVVVRDRADAAEIGEPAVNGREVELPVAGVQDHTLRGVERSGETVRNRMRDGDELDVDRPDPAALAVGHR